MQVLQQSSCVGTIYMVTAEILQRSSTVTFGHSNFAVYTQKISTGEQGFFQLFPRRCSQCMALGRAAIMLVKEAECILSNETN